MARVISQHTVIDDAENPGQFFHFFALLPQELKDVLPSLSSWSSTQVHFPHSFQFWIHKSFYQRIVRRGAGRNSWEREYPRTSAELGSHQPRLLVGRGRHHLPTKHSQWDAIRERSFGLLLITDCGGFAVSLRRFHIPVHRFFSQIRRTHNTAMRRWHSFSSLISRRHSHTHSQRRCLGHTSFSMHRDRRVYSVPRFQPGIDHFIGHLSRTGKVPVYRAPCIRSPIHQDTITSMARGPFAKPPYPSFFGIAKRRTSSKYQSKVRSRGFIILIHIMTSKFNTVMTVFTTCRRIISILNTKYYESPFENFKYKKMILWLPRFLKIILISLFNDCTGSV